MKKISKFILIGLGIMILAFSASFDDLVINYPRFITLIICLVSFLISISIGIKSIIKDYQTQEKRDRLIFGGLMISLLIFTTYILSIVVKLPLNYYNYHYSKEHKQETIRLEISNIGYRNKNSRRNYFGNYVIYKFGSKSYTMHSKDDIIEKIHFKKDDLENYYLELKVKRGLWNSYCILQYKIKHR